MRTGSNLVKGDKVVVRNYGGQVALGRVLKVHVPDYSVKVSWRWEPGGELQSGWFGCFGQAFGNNVYMHPYDSNGRAEEVVAAELMAAELE
jgi:hypothetical protein